VNFENLYKDIIKEKKLNSKPLTGYDYYKSVRKGTPKPGTAFKDKSKYNRKEKFQRGKNVYEESQTSSKTAWGELQDYLRNKGLDTTDMYDVLKFVNRICKGE